MKNFLSALKVQKKVVNDSDAGEMPASETENVAMTLFDNSFDITGTDLAALAGAVLGRGGELKFRARGSSMAPFIKNDDLVTIAPFCSPLPRFGEVVACIHPDTGRFIIHRVVGRKNGSYLIKGDRSIPIDCAAGRAAIVGRVREIERDRKKVGFGLGPERVLIALLSRLGASVLVRSFGRLIRLAPVEGDREIGRPDRKAAAPFETASGKRSGPKKFEAAAASAERRLLLWVGGNCRPGVLDELLAAGINWELFLDLALRHGLAARAYKKFNDFKNRVPPSAYQRLYKMYLVNTVSNLRLAHQQGEILTRFDREKVAVIPLKGIYQAEVLGGDIGIRSSQDIDLLVREEDRKTVAGLLTELGYRAAEGTYSDRFGRFARHGLFVSNRPGKGVGVEIHWNFYLGKPHKMDMGPVWQRAVRTKLNGHEILALSGSDQIFYLAVQQRIHGYRSLKLYVDLNDALGRDPDVDWRYIVERARVAGQRTGSYWSLRFARELLDAPVPAGVLTALRPGPLTTRLLECMLDADTILAGNGATNSGNSTMIFFDFTRMLTNDSFFETAKIFGRLATGYSPDIARRYQISAQRPGRTAKIIHAVVNGVRH